MRKARVPATIQSLRSCGAVLLPILWQPEQFSRGHFNECEHLAAIGDHRFIFRPRNLEGAPESSAVHSVKPAFHDKPIGKFGRAPIIDLGPDHDRISLRLRHFRKGKAELLSERETVSSQGLI